MFALSTRRDKGANTTAHHHDRLRAEGSASNCWRSDQGKAPCVRDIDGTLRGSFPRAAWFSTNSEAVMIRTLASSPPLGQLFFPGMVPGLIEPRM
jgi:hypothetical protein